MMYDKDKMNPGLKKAMGMAKKQMGKASKSGRMGTEVEISFEMTKPMKKAPKPKKKGM